MDLTCLTVYPSIPPVPKLANDSNIFIHSKYNPSGGGLSQVISASLAQSTFSINDVRSLINRVLNDNSNSWSASEVVKIKPVTSVIIYTSITLALFLIFSIVFCVISCRCSKRSGNRRRSIRSKVCVVLLIIVYLLGIGDMIYVAYRVNKAKGSIDDTIKTVNEDIYPRAIVEHVEYLTKEIDRLDRYTVNNDSILINASKSMLVEAFNRIFTEKYLLRELDRTINSTNIHFIELNVAVNNQYSPGSTANNLFQALENEHRSLLVYIQKPLEEVCNYTNGTEKDIDQKLIDALDILHSELKNLNATMREDILGKITPWNEHMLMDKKLEEDIRKYINIGGIVLLVIVILFGVIPVIFLCSIIICRIFGCCQNGSEDNDIYLGDLFSMYDGGQNGQPYKRTNAVASSKKGSSSRVILCLMRIAFSIMIIFLILMILLSGICYALDLAIQGSCRSLHDDQPYLINVLSEQLIKSNVVFGNSGEMNKTISNIIDDCGNQIHFSRKLLDSYWSNITNNVQTMMNTLSERIHEDFIKSIGDINISDDIMKLMTFAGVATASNIPTIVASIETDFTNLKQQFANISSFDATLPAALVQSTMNQFQEYMKNVLESTIDGCPLPLSTVTKSDTLICHTLGDSISGLWLSIFIFIILITVGCCIFGICVYKRMYTPVDSRRSILTSQF